MLTTSNPIQNDGLFSRLKGCMSTLIMHRCCVSSSRWKTMWCSSALNPEFSFIGKFIPKGVVAVFLAAAWFLYLFSALFSCLALTSFPLLPRQLQPEWLGRAEGQHHRLHQDPGQSSGRLRQPSQAWTRRFVLFRAPCSTLKKKKEG